MKPTLILFGLFVGLAGPLWPTGRDATFGRSTHRARPRATWTGCTGPLRPRDARPMRTGTRRIARSAGGRLENGPGLADSPPDVRFAGRHHQRFQEGPAANHGRPAQAHEASEAKGPSLRRRFDGPLRRRDGGRLVVRRVPLSDAPRRPWNSGPWRIRAARRYTVAVDPSQKDPGQAEGCPEPPVRAGNARCRA